MSNIHPTAVINASAKLGRDVEIGPYVVIEGPVEIGDGTKLLAQVHICGHTTIGPECVIHPFAAIGGPPQDHAYHGERSYCRVGARTVIREHVSIHRGTAPESTTTVGSDCMLMATSHVAHNCTVGDHVVMVNAALLAGHVELGHHVLIGGGGAIHQFCRVGEFTMIAGLSRITQDAAPYMCFTERNVLSGLNRVGLRRNGFEREVINELHELERQLFREQRPVRKVAEELRGTVKSDAARRLIDFVLTDTRRGIAGCRT
ncbi:MAG: acyl-ACP--UDP-N-acetylglucosamine O-acyltransferase [Phycisphaerales bacterium]|nr:acyl-ACP--UDP-N-acetylglucosamine O-acyltransferase [Phycisphaerales bacterium]